MLTPSPGSHPRSEPHRILVVDDNVDAVELLAELLADRGYLTRAVTDGHEALDVAGTFRPEAAILDIGMPIMDGYELAGRLRSLAGLSRVKLVALTGYGQPSDRARTEAAGFDAHVIKPVDATTLEQLLAGLFDSVVPAPV